MIKNEPQRQNSWWAGWHSRQAGQAMGDKDCLHIWVTGKTLEKGKTRAVGHQRIPDGQHAHPGQPYKSLMRVISTYPNPNHRLLSIWTTHKRWPLICASSSNSHRWLSLERRLFIHSMSISQAAPFTETGGSHLPQLSHLQAPEDSNHPQSIL